MNWFRAENCWVDGSTPTMSRPRVATWAMNVPPGICPGAGRGPAGANEATAFLTEDDERVTRLLYLPVLARDDEEAFAGSPSSEVDPEKLAA